MKLQFALVPFVAAGCQSAPPVSVTREVPPPTAVVPVPATHASMPRPGAAHDVGAPLVVTWIEGGTVQDGNAAPGSPLSRLVVRVTQPGVVEVPARVTVRFPAGVQVVRGETVQTLPVAPAGTTRELAFDVRFAAPPADPAVAIVDAQGMASGVHAEVPYRFGRPAPSPAPTPMTEPTVVNGFNLGPSVDMSNARP